MQKEKIKSVARCVLGVLGVAGVLTIAAVAPEFSPNAQNVWLERQKI